MPGRLRLESIGADDVDGRPKPIKQRGGAHDKLQFESRIILRRAQEALDAAVVRPAVDDNADFALVHVPSSMRSLQRRMRSDITSRASLRPDICSIASGGIPPLGFLVTTISGISTVPLESARTGARLLPKTFRAL